jgi:cell division transport system permease protein
MPKVWRPRELSGGGYLYLVKSRRRNWTRHVYTFLVLCITLLLAGTAAWCYLWAGIISRDARQDLLYLAECTDGAPVQEILDLKRVLESDPDLFQVEYISPERAATLLAQETLQNAGGGLELEEALPALLAIRLKAAVYEREAVDATIQRLRDLPLIQGIYAQPDLLDHLQHNLMSIGRGLTIAGVVVVLLCILLLSSIIKLSLYADRTEIKTMQLTGATPSYIRRPYIRRYLGLALLSGLTASVLVVLAHFSLTGFALPSGQDFQLLMILSAGITLCGLLLTGWVTFRLVNKYIFADIETLF